MSQTVLIANQDAYEAQAVSAALASAFDTQHVSETAALLERVDGAVAVVLDTNFSEAQAIDVLMEVLTRTPVPMIVITPENDPTCAMEAMRCGAAGFLVKTPSYAELLPIAVQEAIQRSRANEELKRELTELRKRNAALEKQVKATKLKTLLGIPPTQPTLPKASTSELSMEQAVAERIENGTLQLPSYPRIAVKLRQLMQTDVGVAEVAQLLAQDAAVSAKLLRVANAAQYGNLRQVETVEGAVSRLGLANACNLAEMVANRSLYATRNASYRGLLEDLWQHSVAVAHASVAIGRHVGKSHFQHMFSLGLLHDAGRLALMQAIAQADPQGKLIDGEDNLKKFYAFLREHNVNSGVALMQRWGFDQEFVDAVRYNHNLADAEKPSRSLLIVNLANTLARAIGYGDALDTPDELDKSPAKGFLFPGDSDLTPIVDEVHRAMEQTRNMLA